MANFQKAPSTLLKNPPQSSAPAQRDKLKLPGTYNIFDDQHYKIRVPIGNNTWKGAQARVVALWGGDDEGNRLWVSAEEQVILDVILLSEQPIGPHLWAYLVETKRDLDPTGLRNAGVLYKTRLVANKIDSPLPTDPYPLTRSRAFSAPLTVEVMPETAWGAGLPLWNGGNRDQTVNAIIEECQRQNVRLPTQIAYILATAEHESGFTPIRERFTAAREPERRSLSYYPYYGRGYVQLTHKRNYEFYSTRFSIDMVADPDLALQPNLALFILVHGIMRGTFGAPLTQFINDTRTDFLHARQSVNAMDQAQHIAGMAQNWLQWLNQR
jgi:hypothetical protein